MLYGQINLCDFCFEPLSPGSKCTKCGLTHDTYKTDMDALPPGSVVDGRYIIGRVLERVGIFITYMAYSGERDTKVTIKEYFPMGIAMRIRGGTEILAPADEGNEKYLFESQRLLNKWKLQAKFGTNKNIYTFHEAFSANGTVYCVQDVIDGETLKSVINRDTIHNQFYAERIMRDVCNALKDIHKEKMLHTSVCAKNIIITSDGNIRLTGLDNLISMDTKENASILKDPINTPPELYRIKSKKGENSDIYSLGATIYSTVTRNELPDSLIRLVNPQPLDFGEEYYPKKEFRDILDKCLRLKPSKRFKNVDKLLKALDKMWTTKKKAISGQNRGFADTNVMGGLRVDKNDDFVREDDLEKSRWEANPEVVTNSFENKDIKEELDSLTVQICEMCGAEVRDYGADNGKPVFCSNCGSPLNKFNPEKNFMPCIYGSPEMMRRKGKKNRNE